MSTITTTSLRAIAMPLTAEGLGQRSEPLVQHVDARWLMAYAAGIGDLAPCYMDTTRPEGIVGHPMFAVAAEWRPLGRGPAPACMQAMSLQERTRGVHFAHDLSIHRLVRPGDRLSTTVTPVAARGTRAGALVEFALATVDEHGAAVCSTRMHSLYRGVAFEGEARATQVQPARPDLAALPPCDQAYPIAVPANQAHVYTECSRIWAPVHTDRAVALAAGLPDLILHGTCTLALAVSTFVREWLGGDASRVTRIGCRFSGMVLMPSVLTLHVRAAGTGCAALEVLTPQGRPALSDAFLCWT